MSETNTKGDAMSARTDLQAMLDRRMREERELIDVITQRGAADLPTHKQMRRLDLVRMDIHAARQSLREERRSLLA